MRLFVGVDIGDEARAVALRVRAAIEDALPPGEQRPRILWVTPESLHVSLRFIGEVDEAAAARTRSALAGPLALAPFELHWRGVGAFPGPRDPHVLWMGVTAGAAELGALEAAVSARLDGEGSGAVAPFRPHLTLGRVKTRGSGVDWPRVLGAIDVRAACTRVASVTLYQSRLTPRGASYTTVQEAALDARLVTRP